MKPAMRCCHCGRRLARAAGMTERGPVGPVCAVKLGLPRELKPQPPERSKPAGRIRMFERPRPLHPHDPHTLDWIREAATC
jgi:hypothetical protein